MVKSREKGRKTKDNFRYASILILVIVVLYGVVSMAVMPASFPAPSELPAITELPDPFLFANGTPMTSQSEWGARREEIAAYVQHYEFGIFPTDPITISAKRSGNTLNITVKVNEKEASFKAFLNLPNDNGQKCPVFINAGFLSNAIYLSRGYALAEFLPNEIAGDSETRSGIFYQLYPDTNTGVLMAWAWGYHRVIDALLAAVPEINPEQIVVTGHSHYGKAALLAGAFDNRIAVTIPASSGLAGIGNYRFLYGGAENISNIYGETPWWFTPALGEFVSQPERLPIDSHEVAALVAPRALLITQGTDDNATSPRGACLSYLAARTVWEFLGVKDRIGIACRSGSHGMTEADFQNMVAFADQQFDKGNISTDFTKVPYDLGNLEQAIPWSAPRVTAPPTAAVTPSVGPRPTRTHRPRISYWPRRTYRSRVTSSPRVSYRPRVTSSPRVSYRPRVTSSPRVSTPPSVTTGPTGTIRPTDTTRPRRTLRPIETFRPDETVRPSIAPQPSKTVRPSVTSGPTGTVRPTDTTRPRRTLRPMGSNNRSK